MDDYLTVAQAIENSFESDAVENTLGESANIVDAIVMVAEGLRAVARAIRDLGNGDAATNMGAIEAFGKHIGDKLDGITSAISSGLSD
jgi:hypothetical protein